MTKKTLEQYLKTYKRSHGRVCTACQLPERSQIDKALRTGTTFPTAIHRWLVQVCGYDINELPIHAIQAHFNRGHHLLPKK